MPAETEWRSDDHARAEALYSLSGYTKLFLDLLMDHPGERIDTDQIATYLEQHDPKGRQPPNKLHIGASLTQIGIRSRKLGRRLPYDRRPSANGSDYVMKPTVARLLQEARAKVDPGYAVNTRSHLPDGVRLIQLTPAPNQSYNVLLGDMLVGTSEHQESWRGRKFWLFTDLEGAQKWVSVSRHHEDGVSWLISMSKGEAGPDSSPAALGAGYQADPKRREAVEDYAVKVIIARFAELIPGCQSKNVGDDKPGYDIEVTCPGEVIWHIEAKGTEGDCGTINITEGERRHNQDSACPHKHALCVISQIAVKPVGDGFECSGGVENWISPWKIAETVSYEPTLRPISYSYTVPTPIQAEPI
jgi:Family of unknown function (DUF6416)